MVDPKAHSITLDDEDDTRRLAVLIAGALLPGDLVTLSGDLGAGKTSLAREIIRILTGDPDLDVPSPTFTLVQTYESTRGMIVHADLYRLSDPSELAEIGWDEAGSDPIVLVEWPERAGSELPRDRLAVDLVIAQDGMTREVAIQGYGLWQPRLERALAIDLLIENAGWGGAARIHIQGDASSRRYERLHRDDESAILMDAPRRPDGPPIRDGKPYSRIAHLAEDVVPFIALAEGLAGLGLSAPAILGQDAPRGLVLLEDFGDEFAIESPPRPERMEAAADLLVALHGSDTPSEIACSLGTYRLPDYDLDALLIEAELLIDWFMPQTGATIDADERARFLDLWRDALASVLAAPKTWVLRDYHSPNLMWLPAREGIGRIGLLDFQDAVMGHAAYDLVSLLQDARLDVPESLELALLSRYVGARRRADAAFNPTGFAQSYATLGAQRATKILGIFVRLSVRDGKHRYLRHIPRLLAYLARDLDHPALADLREWYRVHVLNLDETQRADGTAGR